MSFAFRTAASAVAIVVMLVASCTKAPNRVASEPAERQAEEISFSDLLQCKKYNGLPVSVVAYLYPGEFVAIFSHDKAKTRDDDEFISLSVDQDIDARGHKVRLSDGTFSSAADPPLRVRVVGVFWCEGREGMIEKISSISRYIE